MAAARRDPGDKGDHCCAGILLPPASLLAQPPPPSCPRLTLILPPSCPHPAPILPPRAPCCPQPLTSHPHQSDPVRPGTAQYGTAAGAVRDNPGCSPRQHPARMGCRRGVSGRGYRRGVQDGVQPCVHPGPSPTHHGGAGRRDPFSQRPEGLLLPRGSRWPGLCPGWVCGTGSRSRRHTLPGASTAATGCTLGQAWPLGLLRQGTRRASQGRKSRATTSAAAGWLWGGRRAAMGQPWAMMGEHMLGRGDAGLASPSPRGSGACRHPAPGGGMVGLYLCPGGHRPARSRRSSTCGPRGSPGHRHSGWGRQRCSSGRASVGRGRVWLEKRGGLGLSMQPAWPHSARGFPTE